MKNSRDQVLIDMRQLLAKLADDWEYSGEIEESTDLFADMGLSSLDVVVLAMSVQQHYDQVLPVADYFAELGRQGIKELTVGDWVDFVHVNLPVGQEAGEAR